MHSWNYFNYFTEIEEYFWKKRGAHLLVSPLDWAIMETWQKAGIPLAYCTDAVLEAAEEQQEAAAGSGPNAGRAARATSKEMFSREEIKAYFARNVDRVRAVVEKLAVSQAGPEFSSRLREIAKSLEASMVLLDTPGLVDLEDLERRLTILDDKQQALMASHVSEERMLQLRREMDGQLAVYRKKMKAEQLALVEKQYIQKRLLEEFGLPRLSLFYLA
jgi:hypothetical protein